MLALVIAIYLIGASGFWSTLLFMNDVAESIGKPGLKISPPMVFMGALWWPPVALGFFIAAIVAWATRVPPP